LLIRQENYQGKKEERNKQLIDESTLFSIV